MAGLLAGRRCLVLGVANDRSIAWSVVKRFAAEGASVLVGVQGERFVDRVNRLAQEEGVSVAERVSVAPCDVGDEEQVAAFMDACGPSCDALVHSIAYASRQAMTQPFLQCTQEQFSEATAVSAHSLVTLARHAAPKLSDRASILAMSYIGAHRAAAEYNAMGPAKAALEATVRQLAVEMGPSGVRVNSLSAGPIATAAARGIPGFTDMMSSAAERSPLRRDVSPAEVAATAAFLASDMASGVTGQTVYVDCGFSAAM